MAFFTSPAWPLFLGNVGVQDEGDARNGRADGERRGEGVPQHASLSVCS